MPGSELRSTAGAIRRPLAGPPTSVVCRSGPHCLPSRSRVNRWTFALGCERTTPSAHRARVGAHREPLGQPWAAMPCGLRTHAANASMPLMTVSKRTEWKRSKECWAPGSSAYRVGLDDTVRRCSTRVGRRRRQAGWWRGLHRQCVRRGPSPVPSSWRSMTRRTGTIGVLFIGLLAAGRRRPALDNAHPMVAPR